MWRAPHRSPELAKRRPWAALGVLLGSALTLAGCQDGYPLAATRCDHWCELLRTAQCTETGPAACIVSCEQAASTVAPCYPEFDTLLACLETRRSEIQASAATCNGVAARLGFACIDEQSRLERCTHDDAAHAPSSSGLGGSSAK